MLALCIGLAAVSLLDTLANIALKTQPELAHRLAPWDGKASSAVSEALFSLDPNPSPATRTSFLATRALLQDATSVEAATVLALQSRLRGDFEESDLLFQHSRALSRRELQVQFWAIEEAVSRGDIDSALRNYDLAMRTSGQATGILFPILASAISEPRIRAPLLDIMASNPPWGEFLINYFADRPASPLDSAKFMREGAKRKLPIDDRDRVLVVNALLSSGEADEAWDFYSEFRRDVAANRSRDPQFQRIPDPPAFFDWVPTNTGAIAANFVADDQGGALEFFVATGYSGEIIQQLQVLPPGTYRLSGVGKAEASSGSTAPYWALYCDNGKELGRLAIPASTGSIDRFQGDFDVPINCPVQRLALVSSSINKLGGLSGQINSVHLLPRGAAPQGKGER
ncbi:hypothetical protein [Altererythrobacter sp. Z27]|uniref:hypothetical protein n=1 Tax=Altererythrobacter sp. Z27 TaxID=3461147 RepID=UPI0040444338